MSYCAYVTTIKNLRVHPNADRLQLGECFGNTVCVNLEYTPDMIGVYFPTDGQLSVEFAEANNLVRKKDENGNNIGGYMDPDKRNIKTIKLRGEPSDGLFLPLSCLEYTGYDLSSLSVGDTITILNGHEICKKYIPRSNARQTNPMSSRAGNRVRKRTVPLAPLFVEHADTEQLDYNLEAFKPGDIIEITLKMHGTSQRTGYLPVAHSQSFFERLFKKNPYKYDYITGTRRVVLDTFDGNDGFYGGNAFRKNAAKAFEGRLHRGEEAYYELVGWVSDSTPIMGSVPNKRTNDKEFIKQYGDTTIFSYGCASGENDFYVYRMTMTNEDGDIVEYPPDFMRYRCEQMGVKTVPVFMTVQIPSAEFLESEGYANAGEWVRELAMSYYDGPDPVGKTHVREGVVVRIVNRPKFTAFKTKNLFFKMLEGLVKESAAAPDIEEAQEENVE